MPDSTNLYRHYDSEGILLYVGISLSAIQRLVQHNRSSDWSKYIADIEVETFKTRSEAVLAERQAIKGENPIFNTIYNGGRKQYTPALYYSSVGFGREPAYRPPCDEGDEWYTSKQMRRYLQDKNYVGKDVEPDAQRIVWLEGYGYRGNIYYWLRSSLDRKITSPVPIPVVRVADVSPPIKRPKTKNPGVFDHQFFTAEEIQRLNALL